MRIETAPANTLSDSREDAKRYPRSVITVPLTLLVVGVASASLYFWGRDLHRFTQWIAAYSSLFIAQLGFYLAACYVVLRPPELTSKSARLATLALIFLFAGAFRAVLAPQRPYLSADVYRYVWDGRVQSAGINPYRYIPEADELNGLRDDGVFPHITAEDRRWYSPYPPVAQMAFRAASLMRPLSVTGVKAMMSGFDLITILLLMLVLARNGLDPARAVLFAWHPLVIFESAHSGHLESLLMMFLAFALLAWSSRKPALSGVALALATLVKFYPVLLLPVFLTTQETGFSRSALASVFRRPIRKNNLKFLAAFTATAAVAYAPYLSAGRNLFGFLGAYAEGEGFLNNGARYFLLNAVHTLAPVPTIVFLIIGAGCLLALAGWCLVRVTRDPIDLSRGAASLIGVYLLLTTPRYAWYYVWIIPFLCFAPRLGWLYLASASALLYLVWYTPFVYPEVPLWLASAIFVPAMGMLAWERFNRAQPAISP